MSSSLLLDRETDYLLARERDYFLDRDSDFGDCIACRELLHRTDSDLAEYERELALRKPSLAMQLAAGICIASAALAIMLWIA